MSSDQALRSDLSPSGVDPQGLPQWRLELQARQIELELQNEALRRAQEQLIAERTRYFDLYELAPVGYCILDPQGLMLEANLTAATLLGVSRSALIQQPFSRLILKADQDIYHRYRQQLLEMDSGQSCELRMTQGDGTPFWVHLATSVSENAQGMALQRVILSDISESKFIDQALRETNVKLESAKLMADKANRAKSEFLSSMSHELRSPLNAILGFAQLMDSGSLPTPPLQKDRIDQILQAGWHLLTLINEILDLATVESGKLSLSLEALSLAEVLSDCEAMMEPLAQQRGIRISFPQFDRPCLVHADRTRLKQVIVNLLSNAIKYNRVDGTVVVGFDTGTPGRVRISVQDSGEGMSEEELAQLFQPFNRLGQEASAVEGSGIGLVVSKRLAELMQGGIGVQSSVGGGSVFWIELNLATAPQIVANPDDRSTPRPTPPQRTDRQRTLLYVEDNQANIALVEQIVARRSDMQLLSALNGSRGIAMARSERPDVILLDIGLPDISGFQALRILREDPATRQIPVLAISANAMPADIEAGLAAGFFRYLTKPIKVDELLQTLDRALEIARATLAGTQGCDSR